MVNNLISQRTFFAAAAVNGGGIAIVTLLPAEQVSKPAKFEEAGGNLLALGWDDANWPRVAEARALRGFMSVYESCPQ